MKLSGTCKVDDAKKPGCFFLPVFVCGSTTITKDHKFQTSIDDGNRPMPGAEEEYNLNGDMVFLHGEEENMDDGKTFAWFEYASRAYPWADYIAKMDMDTFPFPVRIASKLPERTQEVEPSTRDVNKVIGEDCPLSEYKYLGHKHPSWGHTH